MTARVLLDGSALLAGLFEEAGAEQVEEVLREGAAMSAVNVAEVAARLRADGWTAGEVADVFTELDIEIVPFEAETALRAGAYLPKTKRLGLAFGDCACLATARRLRVPAVTANRAWLRLQLRGVAVRVVR